MGSVNRSISKDETNCDTYRFSHSDHKTTFYILIIIYLYTLKDCRTTCSDVKSQS